MVNCTKEIMSAYGLRRMVGGLGFPVVFPLDYMDIFLAYSVTTTKDILWQKVKGSDDTFPAL